MIDFSQDLRYLDFANTVLQVNFQPVDSVWISKVYDDGSIAAVAVFNRFSPQNCEISLATDQKKKWACRRFLRAIFTYPFIQMKLWRVTGAVESDNDAAIELHRHLGSIHEATLKNWFGEKDAVLFRMTKEECKWL